MGYMCMYICMICQSPAFSERVSSFCYRTTHFEVPGFSSILQDSSSLGVELDCPFTNAVNVSRNKETNRRTIIVSLAVQNYLASNEFWKITHKAITSCTDTILSQNENCLFVKILSIERRKFVLFWKSHQ